MRALIVGFSCLLQCLNGSVMSENVYIFEINEESFPSAVLENSAKLPVVVEFMGVWSEHCFAVENILSSLAKEFAGQFIFAKVDIDEQAELRKQFKIENVPTLIVFKDGEAVRVEMGEVNEAEARALLRDFGIGHESDDLREQARAKHVAGDTNAAIMLLTQAIQKHPSNTRVAMDMVQIFIDINELDQAQALFGRLPERDRQSDVGRSLYDQLLFAKTAANTDGMDVLLQRVSEVPDDLQAKLDLAMCYMAGHDGRSAMDQLLKIIEIEPNFQEEVAREMMVSIIRMFKTTHPDIAQEYQRKLSGLLSQ